MAKTRSELAFERFLERNRIPFRPIPVAETKTPDYAVTIDGVETIFEVKELVSDRAWADDIVHGGTVGQAIRERINRSKKQIRTASEQGKPTVLLILNNYDPLQLSGTENHDFEHAMYGEYTIRLDVETREIVDRFHGHNKAFQEAKNTSFSALGRLKEGRDDEVWLTLFENVHAKVPINYDTLPPCFEVVRVERPAATALFNDL